MRRKLLMVSTLFIVLVGCNDLNTNDTPLVTQQIDIENPDELLTTYIKLGDFLFETLNLEEVVKGEIEYKDLKIPNIQEITNEYNTLIILLDRHPVLKSMKDSLPQLYNNLKYLQTAEESVWGTKEYTSYTTTINEYTRNYTKNIPYIIEDYYTQKNLIDNYKFLKEYREIIQIDKETQLVNYMQHLINNKENSTEVLKTRLDILNFLDTSVKYPNSIRWLNILNTDLRKNGITQLETINCIVSVQGNRLKLEEKAYLYGDKNYLQKLENFQSFYKQ